MRVLVLSFPDFVADVERHWLDVPADRPLVVGGAADGPGSVAAACPLARAAGVAVGQPLTEAARRCPSAQFVPGVLDRYAEAASLLDEDVRRSCTAVAWRAIDEAVITEGDVAPGHGPLAAVADAIRTRVRERLALRMAAGIADGEVAAGLTARLVAPAGLLEVLPGYDQRVIAPLPVAWLRDVPAAGRQRLEARGVTTLGALAALDAQAAVDALGPRAGEWQLRAAGIEAVPARATRLPRSLTRAMATPGLVSLADLQVAVEAVTEALAERLQALGLTSRTLTVRVVGADDRFRSRSLSLPEATSGRDALGPVARTLASALWRYGDVPRRVSVVATALSADGPQLTLFGEPHGGGQTPATGNWRTRHSFRALARRPRRAS
ncbi:MAG: hypothetical protein ACLGHP_06505 [Vicinamibacteria bacterium]